MNNTIQTTDRNEAVKQKLKADIKRYRQYHRVSSLHFRNVLAKLMQLVREDHPATGIEDRKLLQDLMEASGSFFNMAHEDIRNDLSMARQALDDSTMHYIALGPKLLDNPCNGWWLYWETHNPAALTRWAESNTMMAWLLQTHPDRDWTSYDQTVLAMRDSNLFLQSNIPLVLLNLYMTMRPWTHPDWNRIQHEMKKLVVICRDNESDMKALLEAVMSETTEAQELPVL